MSKVKEEGDSHYEMLYIVPNQYTEDEAKEIATKIKKLLPTKVVKLLMKKSGEGKNLPTK